MTTNRPDYVTTMRYGLGPDYVPMPMHKRIDTARPDPNGLRADVHVPMTDAPRPTFGHVTRATPWLIPEFPIGRDRMAGLAPILDDLLTTGAGDPAAIWQGADYTTPTCAETVKRRDGETPCGRPFRAVWRESGDVRYFGCPRHGADAKRTAPTDAPTVHNLPGARSGTRRGELVEHVAWCTECGATHTCLPGAHNACGRAWTCPTHGAQHVVGTDLPRPLDTGTAAVWSTDSNSRTERLIARYIDTPRGERIPFGDHANRRGQAVRPEPSEPMTASGRYVARTAAPRADGGAVIVRQTLPGITAPDAFGNVTTRPLDANAPPVRVVAPNDARIIRETVPTKYRAALVRRDARVAPILAAQAAEHAPARSRHAAVASRAAATKRAAVADAKRAERAARAATIADLAALADTLRSNVAAAPVR